MDTFKIQDFLFDTYIIIRNITSSVSDDDMIEKPFRNNNGYINLHTIYSNKNKYATVSQPCKHDTVI